MRDWTAGYAGVVALVLAAGAPVPHAAAQAGMTAPPPVPVATPPAAAGPEAPADEYNMLIREGLAEYDARNWAEALVLFERAHAVQPNARTLRAIGNVAFEMRRYTKAIDALRASLSDGRKP